MTSAEVCSDCGAGTARDQRYCIACGARLAQLEQPQVAMAPAAGPAAAPTTPEASAPKGLAARLPVPDRLPPPRIAALLAAAALGFGTFIGEALGPSLSDLATGATQIIVPGGEDGPTVTAGGGDGEGEGGVALQGPLGNVAAPPAPAPAPSAPPPAPLSSPVPSSPPADNPAPAEPPPPPPPQPEPTPPPPEERPKLEGPVVYLNRGARSYSLVSDEHLVAVHARASEETGEIHLPKPGAKVTVPVRELANGTYAETASRRISGTQTKAAFSATVTYVDDEERVYTVSARGTSALIQVPDAHADEDLPPVGALVDVGVAIDEPPEPEPVAEPTTDHCEDPADGEHPAEDPPTLEFEPEIVLRERTLEINIDYVGYSDFEGIVQAACRVPSQLVISGDGIRESGADISIPVPREFDLSGLAPGEPVNATALIEENGDLELTGLASDEGIRGADDADRAQGDLASD